MPYLKWGDGGLAFDPADGFCESMRARHRHPPVIQDQPAGSRRTMRPCGQIARGPEHSLRCRIPGKLFDRVLSAPGRAGRLAAATTDNCGLPLGRHYTWWLYPRVKIVQIGKKYKIIRAKHRPRSSGIDVCRKSPTKPAIRRRLGPVFNTRAWAKNMTSLLSPRQAPDQLTGALFAWAT